MSSLIPIENQFGLSQKEANTESFIKKQKAKKEKLAKEKRKRKIFHPQGMESLQEDEVEYDTEEEEEEQERIERERQLNTDVLADELSSCSLSGDEKEKKIFNRNQTIRRVVGAMGKLPSVRETDFVSASMKQIGDIMEILRGEEIPIDVWVAHFEKILILGYQLTRSRDLGDVIAAVAAYAHNFMQDQSMTSTLYNLIDEILDLEPHGFEDLLPSWDLFIKHPIFSKIGFLLSAGMSMSICSMKSIQWSPFGLKLVHVEAQKEQVNAVDFMDAVVKTFCWFSETGWQCLKEQSLAPILFSSQAAREFSLLYDEVKARSSAALGGNLPDLGAYEKKVDRALELVKKLKSVKSNGATDVWLQQKYETLVDIKDRLIRKHKYSTLRPAPIGWSISGPTGIGKSSLSKITMRASLEAMGVEYDHTRCITIDEADKYQSTYTSDVMGIYVDDYANIKPALAGTGGDSPAARLIRMFNNVCATAVKAEIDQKGANFFEFLVGVLSTNVKDLNARFFSCQEDSVLRRFYHVSASCKEKFRKKGSVSLDPTHPDIVNSPAGALADLWELTVEECHSFVGEEGKVQWVFRPMTVFLEGEGYVKCVKLDLPTYVRVVAAISAKHHKTQERVVSRGGEIDTCAWCKECSQFKYYCDCAKDTDESSTCSPHALDFASLLARRILTTAVQNTLTSVTDPWNFTSNTVKWLLGYKDIETMCTSELTWELTNGLNHYFVPWTIAFLPHCIYTSSTFQYSVAYWARLSCFYDCRRWLYRLGYFGLFSQGFALYYKDIGLSITFGMIQFFFSLLLYAGYLMRKRQMHINFNSKRNALDEYTRSVRDVVIPNAVFIASVIAVGVAVLRMWNKRRIETQSLTKPAEVDASPGWFSSLMSTTGLTVKTSDKVSNMVPDQLVQTMTNNLWWAVFTRPDGSTTATNAVSFQNGIVLIPEHVFYPNADMSKVPADVLKVAVTRSDKGAGGKFSFVVDRRTYSVRIPELDMRMVYVPNAGNVPSNWKLLPEDLPKGTTAARFIGRNTSAAMCDDRIFVTTGQRAHSQMSFYGGSYNTALAQNGACMSAIISDMKSPCVIGFHIGGNGRGLGVMQTLTQVQYLKALTELTNQPGVVLLAQSGKLPDTQLGRPVLTSTEIHPNQKSIHALTPEAAAIVLGSVKLRTVQKSTVVKSVISDVVHEVTGVPSKWGPPALNPNHKAFTASLEHVVDPAEQFPPTDMERARQDWLSPLFVAMVAYVQSEDFRPMTLKEAIMGVAAKRFFEALLMKTSAGFPLFGKKSKYFKDVFNDRGVLIDRIPDPLILAEFERMMDCWRRGERAYPICSATLKDEATEIGKAKVRVFQAAPVAFSIAIRMYFLPVARFLSLHPILSECAVGINAFSRDWKEFKDHTCKFAQDGKVLGLDYSKFDLRMSSQVTCAVLKSFVDLARKGGYPEADLEIMEMIITDMVHPVLDWNGVLLMLFNMNTSGNNITVNINSGGNSLYARLGFFNEYPDATDFRSCVAIGTYGDDLEGSVAQEYRNFNFVSFRNFLAKHDIKITSPTKTDVDTPFLPIEEADFLKRQSSTIEGLDVPIGRLTEDSIFKSLHANVKSKTAAPNNVALSCMETALHEWFAYGKEHYNMRLEQMTEVAKRSGFPITPAFCSYEERVNLWHEKYTRGFKRRGDFKSEEEEFPIVPHSMENFQQTCTDYSFRDCALRVLSFLCVYTAMHFLAFITTPVSRKMTPLMGRSEPQIQNCGSLSSTWNWPALDYTRQDIAPHSQEMQQNILFTDKETGDADPLQETTTVDALRRAVYTEPAPLSEFFARPVKIFSLSWPISAGLYSGTSFNPWKLFFENVRVSNRLSNFRLLRARLHLKFVINGNAFYFGRILISYRPLFNFDNTTLMRPGVFADLVQASQRPHIYINPTTSQGGEMLLPYFWHKNMTDVTSTEWENMGLVHVNGVAPLAHANGGTDPISLSVFAWCEDIELSVLTKWNAGGISPQSKELKGIVSKPASVVAKVAGSLAVIPQIRPLALATEMGASSIAKMAALFGYSKPTDNDMRPLQAFAKSSLALTDGREALLKLTVDSQNELSIDPAIADLGAEDELSILGIAKRESLLTQFVWPVGTPTETLLWNIVVDPCVNTQYSSPAELHFPACCYAAHPFEFWKGSMKYRFQICASGYHKGRLKFVYDPVGTSATAEYNNCYTQVVDIAENNDFTVEIGWGQPETWRRHFGFTELPSAMYSTAAVSYSSSSGSPVGGIGNGTLSVYVVNDLTVPNSLVNNDVTILVSVSAGNDFEVAQPTDRCLTHLALTPDPGVTPQSLEIDMVPSEQSMLMPKMGPDTVTDSAINKIHYGETIASFRTLLKRYNLHEIMYTDEEEFLGTLNMLEFTRTMFPYYPGYTSSTPADSNVIVNTFTGDYALARMTLLHYLTRGFGAWRGSIRYSLDASCLTTSSGDGFTNAFQDATISVSRISSTDASASSEARIMNRTRYADLTTEATAKKSLLDFNAQSSGLSGLARWTTKFNPIGTFEIPFYSNVRFAPARRGTVFTANDTLQPCFRVSLTMQSGLKPNVIYSYVAAGEDFTLNFFLGAPIFYAQTIPTVV